MGQRHVARACGQVSRPRHRQGPALADGAVTAVGDQVAAHGAGAQVQGSRAVDCQSARGRDRTERECIGVHDRDILPVAAVGTHKRNDALEVIVRVVQQRVLASPGIGYEARRAGDADSAALTHAAQGTHTPAGAAQVPTYDRGPEVDQAWARNREVSTNADMAPTQVTAGLTQIHMRASAGSCERARTLAERVAYRYRAGTGNSTACLREGRDSGAVVAKIERARRKIQCRAGALQTVNRYRLIGL